MPSRVLVVDAGPAIRDLLRLCLTLEGFDAVFCDESHVAERIAESFPLVIVDRHTALDGLPASCRLVLQHDRTHRALTLLLVGREDRAAALDLLHDGLDAFIVKPVGMRELMARVRSLLRRAQTPATPTIQPHLALDGGSRCAADLEIDLSRRQVRQRGTAIHLTEQEFQLLHFLATHAGRVFSRQALLDAVWGDGTHVTPRSVDALIKRLRHRLGREPQGHAYVQTVRGVGYRFADVTHLSLMNH